MSKEQEKDDPKGKFAPFELPKVSPHVRDDNKLTCTTTIRGKAAIDFEDLCEKSGLNRSQLLTQMVYHCLGRSNELKEFYRRVAVLGK
jgi:hypothetical protein